MSMPNGINGRKKPDVVRIISGKRSVQNINLFKFKNRRSAGNNFKFVDPAVLKKRKLILSLILLSSIIVFLIYLSTQTKSSFDIWKDMGNNGNTAEFINSLKGESGDIGEKGNTGLIGETGDSAFSIWKSVDPSRTSKTETDFIKSLKGIEGEKGDSIYTTWRDSSPSNKFLDESDFVSSLRGITGPNGDSTYDTWKNLKDSNKDGTVFDFFKFLKGDKGEIGKSALDIYREYDINNSNSDLSTFISSLKGEKGDIGDSAYMVWKESDPSNSDKTEADFLMSLKGEKGEIGGSGGFTAGEIRLFPLEISTHLMPSGWFLADGEKFSIHDYPDLYSVIGSDILPDLKGKVLAMTDDENLIGSEAGSNDLVILKEENLPEDAYSIDISHSHKLSFQFDAAGAHAHQYASYLVSSTGSNPFSTYVYGLNVGAQDREVTETAGLHSHAFTTQSEGQTATTSTVNLNTGTQAGFNSKQPTGYVAYYIFAGEKASK